MDAVSREAVERSPHVNESLSPIVEGIRPHPVTLSSASPRVGKLCEGVSGPSSPGVSRSDCDPGQVVEKTWPISFVSRSVSSPQYTDSSEQSSLSDLELASPHFRLGLDVSSRAASTYFSQQQLVTICNKVEQSGVPNAEGCRIQLDSHLWFDNWDFFLQCYWDSPLVDFLRYGWPAGYVRTESDFLEKGSVMLLPEHNHKGATEHPQAVSAHLVKETGLNRVLGPCDSSPFLFQAKISPLNSVAKKDSEERRIILDCSFPPGSSVNDHIPAGKYQGQDITLTYPSVDQFARLIVVTGKGCLLFKRDLKAAYRQFRLDPGDVSRLCYIWQGKLYADMVLPMGLRSSAFICQRITNAVSYIFRNMGFHCLNYLDDFGGVEKPKLAGEAFTALGRLLDLLGLLESPNKAVPPSHTMSFLGIWFDTINMTMSIDDQRLSEIMSMLRQWRDKERAKRKEVESLVGHLNFIAKVVRPGRKFMARMFNYLQGLDESSLHTLDNDFKADVFWWYTFLPHFNGVRVIPLPCWAETDTVLETDACLSGCGAVNYVSKSYFHAQFPPEVLQAGHSINVLELLCVLVALRIWGSEFAGLRIKLMCDNTTSVAALNEARIRNHYMQEYMREIAFIAAQNDFDIWAVHIPGIENRLADQLSRLHLHTNSSSLDDQPDWSRVTVCPSYFHPQHNWQ